MSDQHDFSPVRAFDENGLPVPGALAYFYIPGTTAPRDVFADGDRTQLHPSPLPANGAGVFPAVYCNDVVKCMVTTPEGVTLPGYPMDIARRSFGGTSGAENISFSPAVPITAENVQDAIEQSYALLAADLADLGDLAALDQVTTAQIAPAALRTRAEGVGTPLDTEVPTVLAMTGHVSDVAGPKANTTADTVYGPFALALGEARTFAHGFASPPRRVEFWIRCLTASAGLAVGDEYGPITATAGSDGTNIGFGSAVNATTLKTVTGSSQITILNVTTGAREALSTILANFNYLIYVWK